MTRLAWLSDLHLDFLDSDSEVAALCRGVAGLDPDGVLISGDIGNAAISRSEPPARSTVLRGRSPASSWQADAR